MDGDHINATTQARSHSWRKAHFVAIPMHLYHYTDVSGLFGIVSQSSLWATSVATRGFGKRHMWGRPARLRHAIEEYLDQISLRSYYIVCFCSDGDL